MKTTIEFPDATFRLAKTIAAARGTTLKQFITEALEERIRYSTQDIENIDLSPPWMAGFGALADLAAENHRVLQLVEEEFERVSPDDLA